MQKLLIKLSRNKSLVIPVVTIMALSIGISGYYIQDRQIAARKEAERQNTNQPAENANEDLTTYDEVEGVEQPVGSNVHVERDVPGQANPDPSPEVRLEVINENNKSIINVKGYVTSPLEGDCTIRLRQDDRIGDSKTTRLSEGVCEADLSKPTNSGTWQVEVIYNSDDQTQTVRSNREISF